MYSSVRVILFGNSIIEYKLTYILHISIKIILHIIIIFDIIKESFSLLIFYFTQIIIAFTNWKLNISIHTYLFSKFLKYKFFYRIFMLKKLFCYFSDIFYYFLANYTYILSVFIYLEVGLFSKAHSKSFYL